MTYDWDEKEFIRLIKLLNDLLEDYGKESVIPKVVISFFSLDLKLMISIVENPIFYKNPSMNLSEGDYRKFVKDRIEILNELEKAFVGANDTLII